MKFKIKTCFKFQSTLSILERAADYISEIQDKNDQLMYHNGDEVQGNFLILILNI